MSDQRVPLNVTVIVVTWQGAHLIGRCLLSLRDQSMPHRLIVVDNASTDGTREKLAREFPEAIVMILDKNEGFAGGVARALAAVDTQYVALLNNDAVADPEWLRRSIVALEADSASASAAARMLLAEPAGTINNAGTVLLRSGYGADRGLGDFDGSAYDVPAEVFGASGGAAIYRTLALKAVGGFDASYFMYYEDLDVAWRLRLAGWRAQYVPNAVVTHQHAATSDPNSEMFAYHNERNRLITLFRNAPMSFAVSRTARFVTTTAALAIRRLCRQDVPPHPVFLPALRIRVLGGLVRALPRTLRSRRRSRAADRSAVLREWRGVSAR